MATSKPTHSARVLMRCTALALSIQLAWAPVHLAHASIDNDLTSFFNSMGGVANVTNASSFQGQTQNVATGGSLYARLPQRSYNLANIQLPAAKVGCGGIDLFAGSFSYINAEAFAAMLRNIGNNALGYAFQLAIDAVDPMIGNLLDKLRKAAESVNNMNINSCEAGQALVNGIVGKTSLAAQTGCASLSAYLNLSDDRADGIGKCSDPIERKQVADSARSNSAVKDTTPLNIISGNLMARVLDKAYPWMSDSEKRLLISLTGTFIIDNTDPSDATKARIKRIPPSITSEQDIVAGVQGTVASTKVRVPLLPASCIDPDRLDCGEPVATEINSLKYMVDQRLTRYEEMMEAGDGDWSASLKTEMIGFVNVAAVPVMQVLKADFGYKAGLRSTYIDLIAAQYAIYWLESMVKLAAAAVANYPSLGPEEAEEMERMRSDLMTLQARLKTNLASASSVAASMTAMAQRLEEFDQRLRQNDSNLANSSALSARLAAGGNGTNYVTR